jgi:hypothetical protein
MEAGARALWLRDWCEDLAKFPIEAIRIACRKYRQSGSSKFPTPGQLIPMVRAEAEPQARTERVEVWRELSDDEYRALSVREKIRHHQILSHEAYSKAGPMFRNTTQGKRMSGVHLTAEQMPDAWRRWTELGKHHAQEAHRLRQYVSGRPLGLAAE